MLRQSFGGNYDFALHKKVNVCVSFPLTLLYVQYVHIFVYCQIHGKDAQFSNKTVKKH